MVNLKMLRFIFKKPSLSSGVLVMLVGFLFSACQPSLERQPKVGILEEPHIPVEGTRLYKTESNENSRSGQTFGVTRAVLSRGKERYEIYCSACHGFAGMGDGLATERGFGAPRSFSLDETSKLNEAEIAELIRTGRGRMIGFHARIPENDRDAIANYVKVLNLRAKFPVGKLNDKDRYELSKVGAL